MCHAQFGDLYSGATPVPSSDFVWQHCTRSCGYCLSTTCANGHEFHSANLLDLRDLIDLRGSCKRVLPPGGAPPPEVDDMVWGLRAVTLTASLARYDVAGLPIVILRGAAWAPPELPYGCASGGPAFTPMKAHDASRGASCDQCALDADTTRGMVDALVAEHHGAMASAFGLSGVRPRCQAIRPAYTTRTSREHAPDDVHWDICDPLSTARRVSKGYQRSRPFRPDSTRYVPLTAIAFPHARWQAAWGGPLEFVEGACTPGQSSMLHLNHQPAILSVGPLPQRTVVFRADLLHRATLPSDQTGVAVDGRPGANRYSTVLRMLCEGG